MLPTVSDIQPVAVACDLSSTKSSARCFAPVVVTVATVVVVFAGLVFTACPGSSEPSSAVSMADHLREALGASMAVELCGGTRSASLGAVDDDAAALEDEAVADLFRVGSALADVSSIRFPSSACVSSTPSDARCAASFVLSPSSTARTVQLERFPRGATCNQPYQYNL